MISLVSLPAESYGQPGVAFQHNALVLPYLMLLYLLSFGGSPTRLGYNSSVMFSCETSI